MPVLTLVQGGVAAMDPDASAFADRDLSGYFDYASLAAWFVFTVVVLFRTF